jgi:putative oxidoreductase
MNIFLWIVQGLLALVFLLAGSRKTLMPLEKLKQTMDWVGDAPPGLVRFIGLAEILGALGLVLPELTRIVPPLTIAAALGLILVMVSAAVFNASRKAYRHIGVNLALLLLAALVVVGHLAWAPVG